MAESDQTTNTIRGINIPLYACSPSGQATILDDLRRAYDEIQEAGGQGVALNPIHYICLEPGTPVVARPPTSYGIPWLIWPDVGQGTAHPWPQTPSADLVYAGCAEAKTRGLIVMLKPMVDVEGGAGAWRGNISLMGKYNDIEYDRADWWRADYGYRFLQRYQEIGTAASVDMMCMGTELVQITRELGGLWWGDLARGLGVRYPRTYAANWGWERDAEYNRLDEAGAWGFMDKIGVDAYFPLLTPESPIPQGDDPDTDQIRLYEGAVYEGWSRRGIEADWCPRIDDDLRRVAQGDLGRLWFTEIGYRADQDAALNPGEDPGPAPVSEAAQIACIRAARRKWEIEEKIGALWWWDFELFGIAGGDQDPRRHNLRAHPLSLRAALGEPVR